VPESLEALQAVASQIIITTFRVEQDVPKTAIDPMLIQKAAQAAGFTDIKVIKDPRTAYQELLGCSNRLLLITGSFYLLNHIRPLIKAVV
jgi:folylpolyglutamate synthase/dihydropteroate synthase